MKSLNSLIVLSKNSSIFLIYRSFLKLYPTADKHILFIYTIKLVNIYIISNPYLYSNLTVKLQQIPDSKIYFAHILFRKLLKTSASLEEKGKGKSINERFLKDQFKLGETLEVKALFMEVHNTH